MRLTVFARQQLLGRVDRQARRAGLEFLHPRRGVGKGAPAIKAFRIHRLAARVRLQEGIAMRDAAAVGHAVEQGKPALVLFQHELPEAQESVMHVMRRRRRWQCG